MRLLVGIVLVWTFCGFVEARSQEQFELGSASLLSLGREEKEGRDTEEAHDSGSAYRDIIARLRQSYGLTGALHEFSSDDSDAEPVSTLESTKTATSLEEQEHSGYVKESSYKHLKSKLKATQQSLQKQADRSADQQAAQQALDSAKKATHDAVKLETDKKRATARAERQKIRQAAREERREARAAPGLDAPVGPETPAIQAAAVNLKRLKEEAEATKASFKSRTGELSHKVKKATAEGSNVMSTSEKLDAMVALAEKEMAKADSQVQKGKQALARAEARNMADETGQYELVLNIYAKRKQQHQTELTKLGDELQIAQEKATLAQQRLNNAKQAEVGVSGASAEMRKMESAVAKILSRVSGVKRQLEKDQRRVQRYHGLQAGRARSPIQALQRDAKKSEPSVKELEPKIDDELKHLEQRIAALGSGAGPSDLAYQMSPGQEKAAQANEALAKSLRQKNVKDVQILTKNLETRTFENRLAEWQIPASVREELSASKSVLDEARQARAQAAAIRVVVAAAVRSNKDGFPGSEAREKAFVKEKVATQIAATKLVSSVSLPETNSSLLRVGRAYDSHNMTNTTEGPLRVVQTSNATVSQAKHQAEAATHGLEQRAQDVTNTGAAVSLS